MKAFRVKLFGKYITTIPGYNLTRHEDVPLPESSAQPYQSGEEVKIVKFIPSQELSGFMIPITGDTIRCQTSKQEEKDCLVNQYQKRVTERNLFDSFKEDDDLDAGYELIGTEDRLVCVHSTFAEVGALATANMESTRNGSKSEQDYYISDNSIQLALKSHIQPHDTRTSKWVLSASIKLSLRKEGIEEESVAPALCANTSSNETIEPMDALAEEGVEIVPVLDFLDDDHAELDSQTALVVSDIDHVSVLYFRDETKCLQATDLLDDHTEVDAH
jgi:hypothetical protein